MINMVYYIGDSKFYKRGIYMKNVTINHSASQLLFDEAESILHLLKNQEKNCLSCPIYEEIIDTKMYGFSEKVNFAIDLGVIDEEKGQQLLSQLERDISQFYDKVL